MTISTPRALKRLGRDHDHIITPLGNDRIIHAEHAFKDTAVMDWGDRLDLGNGLVMHCEPCHHWSARGMGDRRMALWAAFVLETPGGKIYHIGDTDLPRAHRIARSVKNTATSVSPSFRSAPMSRAGS